MTVNQMEEGRKRVLGIMASILVSRHLKTTEDLHDSRPGPRTESLVGSAVQWAERMAAELRRDGEEEPADRGGAGEVVFVRTPGHRPPR